MKLTKTLLILMTICMVVFNWATWMFVGFLCIFTNYFSFMYQLSPFISLGCMISIIYFARKIYLKLEG